MAGHSPPKLEQVQAADDAARNASQRIKAIEDALRTRSLIDEASSGRDILPREGVFGHIS